MQACFFDIRLIAWIVIIRLGTFRLVVPTELDHKLGIVTESRRLEVGSANSVDAVLLAHREGRDTSIELAGVSA